VITARTVEQALEYIHDEDIAPINAIWLDNYLLGEKTGLDFISECRSGDSYRKDLPSFIVTNTGGHEKSETYMELRATKSYIKSNNRLDDIISDIKEQLEKYDKR
jgi:hypothetical protein